MNQLHNKIFYAFSDFYKMEDAKITYIINSLQNVPQIEFGVTEDYCFPQEKAIEAMKKLQDCKSPIDMLLILKIVKDQITNEINEHQRSLNKSGKIKYKKKGEMVKYLFIYN